MPNPLSQVKPEVRIEMGVHAFFEYPHLASLAMATIAYASELEDLKADVLATLLGTRKSVGLAMYIEVRSRTAKEALLKAAATECVQPKDRQLFGAVMRAVASTENRRNDFAHHIWGFSEDIPNALLLVDSRTGLTFQRKLLEHAAGRLQIEPSWPEFDRSLVMVYTEGDLERDMADAADSVTLMYHLREVVRRFEPEQARQALLREPRIQQCLRPQSSESP